jgi:CPA2 family monovalent cation:H+ antiporter-2
LFANLLIILASSLVVIALFRRLRLPPVLGYLCVGLAVGPTALGWVNDSEELPDLAELGVVFLPWDWSSPCPRCLSCAVSYSASAACR